MAQPNGMSKEKEEELRKKGNLFQEPDSTLLLSSGCGRHWPDARGIFHNDAQDLFVWVNEEDQLRIVSMEKVFHHYSFFFGSVRHRDPWIKTFFSSRRMFFKYAPSVVSLIIVQKMCYLGQTPSHL